MEMRLTFKDVAAMVGAGVMVVIVLEMMVWAITGGYIGL